MKPIKSLAPISIWLMRIGLLLFAYFEYFKTFSKFHLDDIQFYIAALFFISAILILISGFIYKEAIAVISSLVIVAISVYNIIERLDGGLDTMLATNIVIASLALYFISKPSGK